MLHIGTSQHLPQTLKEIALRKPLFMTLYDLQCVAIHFNFGTHHRAENGSFGNVPFSVLVTTRTPTAWTFHFYLPLPPPPQPPRMTGIRTLNFLSAPLEKMKFEWVHFLVPLKNIGKGFKFCRLL